MNNTIKITILSLSTLLIGIFFGHFFTNKPANDTQLDYFSKKQECSKYKALIETKLNEENASFEKTEIVNYLEKIFYSPKVNSCLYITTQQIYFDGKITAETYELSDALSDELLLSIPLIVGTEDELTRTEQFKSIVKKYEQ